MKGEGENGDVVYGVRFDKRCGDAVRDMIKVGGKFLVQADDGVFQVLAYVKSGHQQRFAAH